MTRGPAIADWAYLASPIEPMGGRMLPAGPALGERVDCIVTPH